jgi:nucleoside-diphosphate-sugar epimerase
MEILFTGASSFTGMWFVKELVAAGHKVTATFMRPLSEYTSTRLERVKMLQPICRCIFDVKFGDEKFLELIQSESQWDMLCHHAADVTDYKSPNFDFAKALERNTHNIAHVMESLRVAGCKKILLTGSVFEKGEGYGSVWETPMAFSPYALSKGLTYDVFEYYAGLYEMILGKFVIPNPFGPYEEPRFTWYLIDTWMSGQKAQVKTPEYIRDNVPVTLLAKAYSQFAEELSQSDEFMKYNPSYYVGFQGLFAEKVALHMRPLLGLPCEVEICEQESFLEPKERVNYNPVYWPTVKEDEEAFWKLYAKYYLNRYERNLSKV